MRLQGTETNLAEAIAKPKMIVDRCGEELGDGKCRTKNNGQQAGSGSSRSWRTIKKTTIDKQKPNL